MWVVVCVMASVLPGIDVFPSTSVEPQWGENATACSSSGTTILFAEWGCGVDVSGSDVFALFRAGMGRTGPGFADSQVVYAVWVGLW